jgi:hypothetical protein
MVTVIKCEEILNEYEFTALGEVNSQKSISLSSFFLKAHFIPNVLCQNPLSASDTRRTQQRQRPHFCWSEKRSGLKNARRLLEAERRKCRRPTERERESGERASGGRSGNKKSPRIRGALALRARSRIYMGERVARLAHHPRERQPPCVAGGSNRRSPGPKKASRATPADPHPVSLALALIKSSTAQEN